MAKKMKKFLALILALSMIMGLASVTASAAGATHDGWGSSAYKYDCDCYHVHGDECYTDDVLTCEKKEYHVHEYGVCYTSKNGMICEKEEFTHELTCMSAETIQAVVDLYPSATRKVESYTKPYSFKLLGGYATSGHTYSNGTTSSEAQLFYMFNQSGHKKGDVLKREGRYEVGVSPFIATYCCDIATGTVMGTAYRQVNLEDAGYYTAAEAAKIRAVMLNGYPYYDMETMQANLAAAGVADANLIDEADLMAGTQLAVWALANGTPNFTYQYTKDNGVQNPVITAHFSEAIAKIYLEKASDRVLAVKDYLLSVAAASPVEAPKSQIVISQVAVTDLVITPDENGTNTVELEVTLNSSYETHKDTKISITASAGSASDTVACDGSAVYNMTLEGYTAGDDITVTMSGEQYLETGVYFYEPYAAPGKDVRKVSQNMVGLNTGAIPVGDSVVLETVDIELNKVDENGAALTGAEFVLSHNGAKIDTYTVDENGKATIPGLMPGVTYELDETKIPEGYVGLKKAIKFVVSGDGKAEIKLIDAPEGVRGEIKSSKRILTVTNALPRVIDWHDKEIIIYTPEELVEFAKVSKDQADCNHEGCELGNHTFEGQKIILGNDIDLGMIDGEEGWWYFDKYEFAEGESKIDLRIVDFRGTFDGAGNTIYNMKYYDEKGSSKPSEAFLALSMFRVLYGTVQDLTIDGVGGYFKDKFAAEKELLPAQTARSTRFFSLAYKTCGALIDGVTVKNIDVEMNNNVEDDVYSSFNGMLGIVTWESGGTCGNGKYTAVNDCHVVNATALVKGNSQYAGGGLAYKASEMASFTDCSVSNVTVDIKGSVDNYGGFIGEIGLASVVDNCDVDGFTLTAAQNNYGVGGFVGDTVGGTGWGDSLHATGCDVMNSQITIGTLNAPLGGFIGDLLGGRSSIITGCKVYPTVTLTVKDLVEGSNAGVGGFIGGLTGRNDFTTSSEHLIYGCNSYANINTINAPAGGFVGAAVKGDGNQMRVVFDTCVADGKIVAKDADAYGFGGFDSGKDIGSKEAGDKSYDEYINCGDYNDVYGDEPETGDQVRTFAGTSTYSRLSAEGYSELTDTTEGSTLYTTYQTPEVAATYNLRFRSVAPVSTDNTVEVSFYRYNAGGEYENWRTIELYKETAFDGTGYVYADSSEGYRLEGGLASVAAQTEENTDMVFLGWADADGNEFTESTLVCADVEVYAQYGYTVSYEYIGEVPAGAPELPAATDYAVGAEVTVANAPTLAGYNFSGWTAEPALEDGKMPEGDVVISGYWVKIGAPMVPPVVEEEPTEEDVIEEDVIEEDVIEEDILDEDAPLDEAPVVDSDAAVEENADENAPMADVPETGDMTALWVAMSAVSAAGLFIVNKKSKDEE